MWYLISKIYNMKEILTSKLQKDILKHIILNEEPNYKTISIELDKDITTIRQSIESLLKKQCITTESVKPGKKGKKIFKPTIAGLAIGLGYLDIKFEQIKNNAEKVTNIDIYQEFKDKMGTEKLDDFLKICSIGLIHYELINKDLNQIISESYSFVKFLLRISTIELLLNKNFDIENLFLLYPNETFYKQNIRDVVPLKILKLQKQILIKIKDKLQKTIDLLPE